MAKIVNPTNGAVPVPLLIEDKHLLALDEVFDDFVKDKQGKDEQEEEVSEIGEPRSKTRTRPRRSVVFYLSGGRTVRAQRFAEAMTQPHVSGEEPIGFRADIAIGRIEASVSLSKLSRHLLVQPVSATEFQVVGEAPQLRFTVEPSDNQFGQELFGALENWAAEFFPSTWAWTWSRLKFLCPFLLMVFWVFTAVFWDAAGGIPSSTSPDYRREAHMLLQQGINENNQRKAIELLLAITSAYSPERHIWKFGRTYWIIFVAGTVMLGMLSFCPTVVIGVWKGKQKLTRWRWWMKTVSVTIPSGVITIVLLPKLSSKIWP